MTNTTTDPFDAAVTDEDSLWLALLRLDWETHTPDALTVMGDPASEMRSRVPRLAGQVIAFCILTGTDLPDHVDRIEDPELWIEIETVLATLRP